MQIISNLAALWCGNISSDYDLSPSLLLGGHPGPCKWRERLIAHSFGKFCKLGITACLTHGRMRAMRLGRDNA
jgi:hypothetical protein